MSTAEQPPSEFAAAHGSPTPGEITPSVGSGMPLGVGGEKRRWPHADALVVAKELLAEMKPHCRRIIIAGSLRRRKPIVGDVEILFVPSARPEPVVRTDMFSEPEFLPATDAVIESLLARGVIVKRPNVNGGTSWGTKNKLAIHCASGIPVDLFATTDAAWWNYLVCRTGGEESNVAICTAAIRKGWKWNPYGEGFTERVGLGAKVHPVSNERDVFELVGLEYREPWERDSLGGGVRSFFRETSQRHPRKRTTQAQRPARTPKTQGKHDELTN